MANIKGLTKQKKINTGLLLTIFPK